ncbi:unnamed protein product [Cuscuta epithymum]|uniref:Uncharacterized protein n=1 Tax=Cuscuta epithymum TaxID=186058 RepID=A0AAV0FW20_9ASTE|nr:unnamed protein product [Cuscuta epithymum]
MKPCRRFRLLRGFFRSSLLKPWIICIAIGNIRRLMVEGLKVMAQVKGAEGWQRCSGRGATSGSGTTIRFDE